jgi:magnesium and cobalt exporter, CNNM family
VCPALDDISYHLLQIILITALILFNGFFVAAEFALVKVRRTQIESRMKAGSVFARLAYKMLGKMDTYLSACQLGITITSLGVGWLGEPYLADYVFLPLLEKINLTSIALAHTLATGVALLLITYLHIVVGEMAPKSWAITKSEGMTLFISYPLHIFYLFFYPFIWLLNFSALFLLRVLGIRGKELKDAIHSEDELRMILASSYKGGEITQDEHVLMERAFDFSDIKVRQIMVPRPDVVFLREDQPIDEMIRIALDAGLTRFPLCSGDLDHVLGMIHIKDLFFLKSDAEKKENIYSIIREIPFVPESMTLGNLLKAFKRKRTHAAVVVDEYGGTHGLITLEDVIEELVGDIKDEFDTEVDPIRPLGEGRFLLRGDLAIHTFNEKIGYDTPETHEDTIAGMVIEILGHVPQTGEKVNGKGYSLTIREVDNYRIISLLLTPLKKNQTKE